MHMDGGIEETTMSYIIRDHDRAKFEEKKAFMTKIGQNIQAQYGEDAITVAIEDQYYNMGEKIEPVMEIVDIVKEAFKKFDITPIVEPIRGGTDGSQLPYNIHTYRSQIFLLQ